jgi:two-component system response regulator AtoC
MGAKTRHDDAATESLAAKRPVSKLALLLHDRVGARTVTLPDEGRFVIGRGRDCDLVVDDRTISRYHAALHIGAAPTVEDLGSHNGTRVCGTKIRNGARVALPLGATVELGVATIVVYRHATEMRPAEPRGTPVATSPAERGIVVADAAMERLYGMLPLIGPSAIPVLLLGETGTGKEVFARAVHDHSNRAAGPYVPMSCAAVPDALLESELFGFEKGAFSGAAHMKPGLIESASGGTLFLDELGEMPLGMQAKLLRVIETGELRRLGSIDAKRVDVRFVAATHRDLQAMVHANQFRADLFFRLNGFALLLPPLRARTSEILPLAKKFLASSASLSGRPSPSWTHAAEELLVAYAWPGNVRELRYVVERAAALCRGQPILPEHLMLDGRALPSFVTATTSTSAPSPSPTAGAPEDERTVILSALARASGNQKEAAKHLAIPLRTFIRRLEKYGIERPRKGRPPE